MRNPVQCMPRTWSDCAFQGPLKDVVQHACRMVKPIPSLRRMGTKKATKARKSTTVMECITRAAGAIVAVAFFCSFL